MNKRYIYCLTFPNNKKYVGQTINFNERMKQHVAALKRKKYKLYTAINKYGWDNVKKEILLICDFEMADYYEKKIIEGWKLTDHTYGYNLLIGGPTNKQHSLITKQKISNSNKGKIHSKLQKYKQQSSAICIPIWQYDKNGMFIQEWPSARHAERCLKIEDTCINACINKKAHSAGGFIWLKATGSRPKQIKNITIGSGHKIKIAVFSVKTNEHVGNYNSLTAAIKELNLTRSILIRCISSNPKYKYNKTHRGYYFKRI